MTIFLVLLHVFVCLFLIVVILLQAGRGQGLSWGTFGGSPQSILGTKTASFLTKMTTAVAIVFLFTCISLNVIETQKSRSLLAPSTTLRQVDFDKIKAALDDAELEQGAIEMLETVATQETVTESAPPALEISPVEAPTTADESLDVSS